ncbi:MAG: hypothetical protein JSV03_16350 [Planctomycetota bacterium]|nr:MAG: hypothetical protein JSV03_16350 [Planctomycetota bacterium]
MNKLVLAFIVVVGIIWGPDMTAGVDRDEPLTLFCPQVSSSPTLDGDLSDSAWKDSKPIHVFVHQPYTSSGIGNIIAELRACWSGENIYMAVRWPDPSPSIKKDLWMFDGKEWTKDRSQDEDRLALIFPVGETMPNFRKYGCAITCHAAAVGSPPFHRNPHWYHKSNGPKQRIDAWHWKSVRSNPLNFADDKYWDDRSLSADPHHAGRHPDAEPPEEKAEQRNINTDRSRPAMMQDPRKPASIPGFLLAKEAIPIDLSRFKAGDIVPGRIISRARGSRGDVSCGSVHRDGYWNVELSRKLRTGHVDDVVFKPDESLPFSLAIFENVPEYRKEDHGKIHQVLLLQIIKPPDPSSKK